MDTTYTNPNMQTKSSFGFAKMLFHPILWLLTALAIVGDTVALFQFQSMYPPLMQYRVLFYILLTLFAESAIVYFATQKMLGFKPNLINTIMDPLVLLPRLFMVKMIILIPAAILILLYVMSAPFFQNSMTGIIVFSIIGIPVILVLNIITLVSFTLVLVNDTSIGEAVTQAGWQVKDNFGSIFLLGLPFIFLEGLIIFFLITNGIISYESAFIFTVTPEMADFIEQFNQMNGISHSRFSQAGDYFLMNRPLNGLVTASLKNRGLDLLSPLMYTINATTGAVMIMITNFILIPLQLVLYCYWFMKKLKKI